MTLLSQTGTTGLLSRGCGLQSEVSGDVCTVTCCAAFAPAPVPASSATMLLLMATVIIIEAYRRIAVTKQAVGT